FSMVRRARDRECFKNRLRLQQHLRRLSFERLENRRLLAGQLGADMELAPRQNSFAVEAEHVCRPDTEAEARAIAASASDSANTENVAFGPVWIHALADGQQGPEPDHGTFSGGTYSLDGRPGIHGTKWADTDGDAVWDA